MRVVSWVGFLVVLGLAAAAGAQQADRATLARLDLTGRSGNFNPAVLAAGSVSDHPLPGRARGGIDASGLGSACAGFIARRPDHVVTVRTVLPRLQLAVESDSDTTLVVRTPDGRFLCADDAEGGDDPRLSARDLRPGRYLVWVGIKAERGNAAYRLAFSE